MKPQTLPTRTDAVDAAAAGAAAARANQPVEQCPYPANAPSFAARALRRFWLRGHQDATGSTRP